MTAEDAEQITTDAPDTPDFSVAALSCSAERTVFTEDDNDDAWISTNTTVEVER